MSGYKRVLPKWCLYLWLPINIFLCYKIVAAGTTPQGLGFALPVIFVFGIVSASFTFLILDILMWLLFFKRKITNSHAPLTSEQRRAYQYDNNESHAQAYQIRKEEPLRVSKDSYRSVVSKEYDSSIDSELSGASTKKWKPTPKLVFTLVALSYLIYTFFINQELVKALLQTP